MRIPRAGAATDVPARSVSGAVPAAGSGAVAAAVSDPLAAAVAAAARRLRSGELDVQGAVELLIDETVASQLGPGDPMRNQLAVELKQLLLRYADADPHLSAAVSRLGKHP